MYKNNVYTFRNFPVEQNQRKCTDCICTIIGAIFALILFIWSFFAFTKQNYFAVNYPVDNTGKQCYYKQPDAPFIYFANINDLTTDKYCVSECPGNGQSLMCSLHNNCNGIISTYDSTPTLNSLGGFCEPTHQKEKQRFWSNRAIDNKFSLIGGYSTILITLLIALGVGIIYLVIFILIPRIMTYTVFIFAFITLVIGGIILIVQPIKLLDDTKNFWNIFLGIIFIIIAILLLIFFFCYVKQIQLGSIFLYYSNIFLKENPILFAYIPLFILLSFGLVVLCIWQFIAFGTWSEPELVNKGDLYYSSHQNVFLEVLNAIQFIWGIQFLRDTFNYIISGNAVQWYFNYRENRATQCSRPFIRFITRNFGSVVGGSFLNAFFSLFDIIYNIFRCDPRGSCGKASSCWKYCCCCCNFIFELARPDAYAYIHLSGVPYCDAARQCQAICERSNLFFSNYTCIKLYRISGQIFLVSLTALLSFIVLQNKADYGNFIIMGLIICFAYLIVTYFIDIHSNGAEGIVTCYLTESNCESPMSIEVCPDRLRGEVFEFQTKYNLH